MGINLGGIFLSLRAKNSQFRSSLRQSAQAVRQQERALRNLRRQVKRVNQRFRQFRSSVLSVRGAVGILAGGAGVGLLVKRSIDAADSIAKTADAIGISTDALQELRFAADIAGVSIDGLDKAMKFATKSIGELRTRTSSELTTALKDFDSQLLSNIKSAGSVEEAVNLIFQRMGELEDSTKKAALAKAAFGRAGIDLVNIVKGEAGALEAMRKQARRLGIVIEEGLLRSAERAKDSLTILGRVLEARVSVSVLRNAESINRLAQNLTETLPRAISFAGRQFQFLIDNVEALKRTVIFLGSVVLVRFVAQVTAAATALGGLTIAAAASKIGLAALSGPVGFIAVAAAALGIFALQARSARTELDDFKDSLAERLATAASKRQVSILTEGIDDLKKKLAEYKTEIENIPKFAGETERTFRIRPEKEIEAERARIRGLLEQGQELIEFYEEQLEIQRKIQDLTKQDLETPLLPQLSNLTKDLEAFIAAEERAARQTIELSRANDQARIAIQARHQVENQLFQARQQLTGQLAQAQKQLEALPAGADASVLQARVEALKAQQVELAGLTKGSDEYVDRLTKIGGELERLAQADQKRASVLEANIAHQRDLNEVVDQTIQLEKDAQAVRDRIAGKLPAGPDQLAQEAVRKRIVDLVRELSAAQANQDEAAEVGIKRQISLLGEYRAAILEQFIAQEQLTKAQAESLALDQAQSVVEANSAASVKESLQLQNQRLEAANRLLGKTGEELFFAQVVNEAKEKEEQIEAAIRKLQAEGLTTNEKALAALQEELALVEELGKASEENLRKRFEKELEIFNAAKERAKQHEEQEKALKKQADLGKEIAQTFTSGLESFILATKSWQDALRGVAQALVKIVLQQLVINRLQKALSSFFGSAAEALGGGLAPGKVHPGRQGGGPAFAGHPYLVGEGGGAELFVPSQDGTVIPNYKLRSQGEGATVVNLMINVESTDGPGVRAAIDEAIPEIVEAAVEASQRVTQVNANRPSLLRGRLRRG